MDKEALIARLKELDSDDDPASAHSEADGVLLAFIDDEEVTAAYRAIPKWYA